MNDTRPNYGKSHVFEIFHKIEYRSVMFWTLLCYLFHQKKYLGLKNECFNTTFQKLRKIIFVFYFAKNKSIFEIVCRIGDRILQAKQRHWSWKRAKIFATFNLRDPKPAKDIIIDSDARVTRDLPKNHTFLPYEKFLCGNEMKLLIKYQGFVDLTKSKSRSNSFSIQEIRTQKKGWSHIGCLGENFPSDTPSEIRYMLMCVTCRLKMSTGTDSHHLQLGVAEHITFLRDMKKFQPPCSIGSIQFLVRRQIKIYDARIIGKIERLTDKVIEALASGIVKRGDIKQEDQCHLEMIEKIGRQISARTALRQVWLPTPVTPTLVSQVPSTWDVGTSSTSDISFSASNCSLSEIFPSPEPSPEKLFESESSDSEEPFFITNRVKTAKKAEKVKTKSQKRRRSASDPGLKTGKNLTEAKIKEEPPSLTELTELPRPKISKAAFIIDTEQAPRSAKKQKKADRQNNVSRKSPEKRAEVTHSEFATLRSALSATRKRDWSLDEVLILKGEAQEIVKTKARQALDSAPAADRKALHVLLNFD